MSASAFPQPRARSNEVRQCPKCNQPAVVLAFEWKHTVWGGATGSVTRDFRCQNCGAKFTLRPRGYNIGLWVAGVLLTLTTLVLGLPFLYVAWRRGRIAKQMVVVPGAPLPPMRYRGGPPVRTCAACGGYAVAFNITRRVHNGIPSGTEYEYRCMGCQAEFMVESVGGMLSSLFAAVVIGAIAAAFWFGAHAPGWRFGGAAVAGLLAVFMAWTVFSRLRARANNPVAVNPLAAPSP